jgi:hypothetical protein
VKNGTERAFMAELVSLQSVIPAGYCRRANGMAEVRYLVVKKCDGWKVVSGSVQTGPFADRVRAIEAAIELADRTGRDGRDSQVLVRGEDRRDRIEWTYGRDPYPEVVVSKPPPVRHVARRRAPGLVSVSVG